MTECSGCGLVKLTVLESLGELTAGRVGAFVKTSRALTGIENRIGLDPEDGLSATLESGAVAPGQLLANVATRRTFGG